MVSQDGHEHWRLTEAPPDPSHSTWSDRILWSPDGRWIIYNSGGQLHVLASDGTRHHKLQLLGYVELCQAHWLELNGQIGLLVRMRGFGGKKGEVPAAIKDNTLVWIRPDSGLVRVFTARGGIPPKLLRAAYASGEDPFRAMMEIGQLYEQNHVVALEFGYAGTAVANGLLDLRSLKLTCWDEDAEKRGGEVCGAPLPSPDGQWVAYRYRGGTVIVSRDNQKKIRVENNRGPLCWASDSRSYFFFSPVPGTSGMSGRLWRVDWQRREQSEVLNCDIPPPSPYIEQGQLRMNLHSAPEAFGWKFEKDWWGWCDPEANTAVIHVFWPETKDILPQGEPSKQSLHSKVFEVNSERVETVEVTLVDLTVPLESLSCGKRRIPDQTLDIR